LKNTGLWHEKFKTFLLVLVIYANKQKLTLSELGLHCNKIDVKR